MAEPACKDCKFFYQPPLTNVGGECMDPTKRIFPRRTAASEVDPPWIHDESIYTCRNWTSKDDDLVVSARTPGIECELPRDECSAQVDDLETQRTTAMNSDRPSVSPQEISDMLRRVGNGQAVPRLKDPSQDWHAVYAGNVIFDVDEWHVEVFNDCGDWDYLDNVIAPDGRVADYDDWARASEGEGVLSQHPQDILWREDEACMRRMQKAFIEAK